jgi:flagellar protein FliT
MTQQTLLDAYVTLLSSASHMHELASAEQWPELIEQRTEYVMLVDKLRHLDTEVSLNADGQQRKAELLERILEHDVEVRRQLLAKRDELGKLIDVSQRERRLHRTYGPQQGPTDAFYTHHEDAVKRTT